MHVYYDNYFMHGFFLMCFYCFQGLFFKRFSDVHLNGQYAFWVLKDILHLT